MNSNTVKENEGKVFAATKANSNTPWPHKVGTTLGAWTKGKGK